MGSHVAAWRRRRSGIPAPPSPPGLRRDRRPHPRQALWHSRMRLRMRPAQGAAAPGVREVRRAFPGWAVAVPAPCRAPWFPSATSRTWRRPATSCARTTARAAPRPAGRAVSPPRGPGERVWGWRWWPCSPRPSQGSVRRECRPSRQRRLLPAPGRSPVAVPAVGSSAPLSSPALSAAREPGTCGGDSGQRSARRPCCGNGL